MIVPGVIMLFILLISTYSLGTELKFATSKKWLEMADNNIMVAMLGKFLPQTVIWLAIVYGYEWYVFCHLGFPHLGSPWMLVLLGLMQVLASQGFGIFAFGLMPSLRISWLFPLRHYWMMYQTCVFNGFSLVESWFHFSALAAFMLLPWLVIKKIKNAMLTYVYIP